MKRKKQYHLFEVTGVELEYMIVDRNSLNVKPICDDLLRQVTGIITSDFENGTIAWSNELVNHVVELKTNGPVQSRVGLHQVLHENVLEINQILKGFNAMLLPGGAHPWMNPYRETHLWPHKYHEIYHLYDRIFNCKGHGWSNLQSTHINLPFSNNDEFKRLHAAIRLVLPIIPAISASTPFLDGQFTGYHDSRMEVYRHNQDKIPSIAGVIIPEAVFSKEEYHQQIFDPIVRDLKPFDPDGILDKYFLNSRGAIARFDRGAIEIRIIDNQESPLADMAVVDAVVALIKLTAEGFFGPLDDQIKWNASILSEIFLETIRESDGAVIQHGAYSGFWGCQEKRISAGDLWRFLLPYLKREMDAEYYSVISMIIHEGPLARRLIAAMGNDYSQEHFRCIYSQLAQCLDQNRLFMVPCG
ncbi:carboxylate-amine ligase [Thermophagus sp. OGC60D27]|uniref:carboxylate-amine ligase n=1 Tax=Thermophagus sp. OGC60D27 TaxID=3458415 RepID=UPI0040383D91